MRRFEDTRLAGEDVVERMDGGVAIVRLSRGRVALRADGRTEDAAVQADEAWVMSAVAGQERSGMFRHLVDDVALSPREREIAEMIARPMTTAEVATALQMSVRTVETHLHNVGRKIGTSGRDQLVRALTTWSGTTIGRFFSREPGI